MKSLIALLTSFGILLGTVRPAAAAPRVTSEDIRQHLFETMQALTGVSWAYLAAMDQYEKNIGKQEKASSRLVSIPVPSHLWAGLANPDPDTKDPAIIRFFDGIGKDANGDGNADPNDDLDVLYSVSLFLTQKGTQEDRIREQLWQWYQHPVTVDVITHIAKVYEKNGTMNLNERAFPLPLGSHYSYRSTWGDRRSFGGLRIHEGTDIFADYGTPVKSTCHGYVELIGWNRFGGWRIGIRDTQNRYHYFAHLSGFRKGLKKGDIVKPGELIGYVGSSGYGPPGTSGKFPPHLHYGIYRFNGKNTFSYDPYPLLRKWERDAAIKRKKERMKLKAEAGKKAQERKGAAKKPPEKKSGNGS
ncbi:M23 family metallopeptidase [Staphylospora marina]|uniref:M23 family metallopeptidase n=1 Tax=Staphylospora marina TaxID=2490858 RepID=UPI0024055CDD|nr:M23 family metallopeptidase [Staphylospora marina]